MNKPCAALESMQGIGIREGTACQTDWQKGMINILITVKAHWTVVHPQSFLFSPNPTGVSPSPYPNCLTQLNVKACYMYL